MTIIIGANKELEMMASKWLRLNDPQEPERYEAELESENIIEISLQELRGLEVDIISVVESEIDDFYGLTPVDPEQFLLMGTADEVSYGSVIYKQGRVRVG